MSFTEKEAEDDGEVPMGQDRIKDLFSDDVFEGVDRLVAGVQERYGMDISREWADWVKGDEYAFIRTVNFVRALVFMGEPIEKVLEGLRSGPRMFLRNDMYLKPFLKNDPLLYAFDDLFGIDEEEDEKDEEDTKEKIEFLEAELEACRLKIRSLLKLEEELDLNARSTGATLETENEEDEESIPALEALNSSSLSLSLSFDLADGYFEGYGEIGIHEEMLQDKIRTKTYQIALEAFVSESKELIVFDVGCGTGILSMFAARAGAKHVIAVEASKVASLASRLVERNGFAEKIDVHQCLAENLPSRLKPDLKADVIVSEWMGYGLLFESMLDSVLDTRGAFLKPNGIMIPSRASLFLQGQANMKKFDQWKDIYGFDFSEVSKFRPKDPLVEEVDPLTIATDRVLLKDFDLRTVTKEMLDFTTEVELTASRDAELTNFVISFDCLMLPENEASIVLSTAAEAKSTHWRQTCLYLNDFIPVRDNEKVKVHVSYLRNKKNKRDIDIVLRINEHVYRSYTLAQFKPY